MLGLRYAEITPQVDRAYQAGGWSGRLEAAAQALEGLSQKRSLLIGDVAQVYLLLGQRDKALDWLERIYERGSPEVIFFRRGWVWQSLRSEPVSKPSSKKSAERRPRVLTPYGPCFKIGHHSLTERKRLSLESYLGIGPVMRVALVVMPFAASKRPSLAAGLLKALLAQRKIGCECKYFNVTFFPPGTGAL